MSPAGHSFRVLRKLRSFFETFVMFDDAGEWRELLDNSAPGRDAAMAARRIEKSIHYQGVLAALLLGVAVLGFALCLESQVWPGISGFFGQMWKELQTTIGSDENAFFSEWRRTDPHSYFLLAAGVAVGGLFLLFLGLVVILVLTLAIAFGISGSANRKRLQLLVHLLTRHQEKQESAKDLEAV